MLRRPFLALALSLAAGPAWATTFTDTFSGTVGTFLDSDGSSPAWAHDAGSNASATTVNGSGKVQGSVANGGELAPSTGSADHYIQFTTINLNMSSFAALRMTDSNNYCGFRITGGNTYEFWKRSGGTFTALVSKTFVQAGVTATTTSVAKVSIVNGTGDMSLTIDGTTATGMTAGCNVNTTTQTPGIHNRGNELIVGSTWTSDTTTIAPAITISDPSGSPAAWRKDKQTLPVITGTTSGTVTFSGTYAGTAPSGVDVQLCSDNACSSVVSAYATLSSATITGGNWSGTLSVPATATYLFAKARETSATSVASAVTAKSFNVGSTPLEIGQSLAARQWENSAQLTDAVLTSGSPTVTSTVFGGLVNANAANGCSITGTGIPGGTTILSSSGSTITMSANASSNINPATINFCLTPPSTTAGTTRYQGDLFYPTSDAHHAAENDTNTTANAEGAITEGNTFASLLGWGASLLQYAVGSTRSDTWTSPAGGGYTTVNSGTVGVPAIGSDFDWAYWNQGQSDELAMTQSVTGAANNGSGLCRLTVTSTYEYTTGKSATATSVGGATGCNVTANITVVDTTHVDLQGTTFGGAYTSGGSIVSSDATVYSAALTNIEAWVHGFRSGAGFGVVPVGIDTSGVDNSVDAIRQAHLTYIDTNTSGKVFYAGLDIDLPHQDQFHLLPAGRVSQAKRKVQAYARFAGQSSSGYGPKIASMSRPSSGTIVTVTVTHEAGTALRSAGLSTSGTAITGFKCTLNGSNDNISATTFVQPNQIQLTLASSFVNGDSVQCSYLAGANPTATNAVYDNVPPSGDTNGLPLQPSRGTNGLVTASVAATGGGFVFGPFGANDDDPLKLAANWIGRGQK